jgi:hypothetical protein
LVLKESNRTKLPKIPPLPERFLPFAKPLRAHRRARNLCPESKQ